MTVSHQFDELLSEFREAQVRFEEDGFRIYGTHAGRYDADALKDPIGRASLFIEIEGRLYDKGYLFEVSSDCERLHQCRDVFSTLAVRAAGHLPANVQIELQQYEPSGPCGLWMAFLATLAKDASLVREIVTDGFPLFMWTRPFAGSANAIELHILRPADRPQNQLPVDDGPREPNEVWKDNQLITRLEPQPFKLFSLMWKNRPTDKRPDGRNVDYSRACEAVAGHPGNIVSDASMSNATTAANKALVEFGLTFGKKGNSYIWH